MGVLRKLARGLAIAWHKPRHWTFRPGTFDKRAFRNVVVENEYRLPRRLPADCVILDIGANVGAFALAALHSGARRIECYEPEPANFAQLERNLRPYAERIVLHRAALWSEGITQISLCNPVGGGNTGAVQVTVGEGPTAPVQVFDEVIDRLSRDGRLLVKMDCEGAEWPILFASQRLGVIETLLGEYHLGPLPDIFDVVGLEQRAPEAIGALLEGAGFVVEIIPNPESPHGIGHFFATKPTGGKKP